MPTGPELAAFLARRDLPFRLRDDERLNHLHWATTRRGHQDELTVLAIDHRSQFEELGRETKCSAARIEKFKNLAFQSLDRVASGDPRFGIIVDERFGFDVLAEAADHPYWTGRPIEVPKSRPVEFEGAADVGLELRSWPAGQVVKCLAFYAASDPQELRERQERQLLRLFTACRETGHELLLEILSPEGSDFGSDGTAAALERLYQAGIKPDWWKLEPTDSDAAWSNIVQAIESNDPYCRGVVLLGLSAPIDQLTASFDAAARFPLIKGFAVGRTIFHDVAREWLNGETSDHEAVDRMAARLSELVTAWRTARARLEDAA